MIKKKQKIALRNRRVIEYLDAGPFADINRTCNRLHSIIDQVCNEHESGNYPNTNDIDDVMEQLLTVVLPKISDNPSVDEGDIEYIKTHRYSKSKLKATLYQLVHDCLKFYGRNLHDIRFADIVKRWDAK